MNDRNESINKYIGNQIRKFRNKKNVTLEEVAEYLKTSPQAISRYELGDRKTDNDTLFKLADYFNVSINDFFPPLHFDNGTYMKPITDDENMVKIPVLGIIKAGLPIEAQEDIIDYVEIPKSWLKGDKKFYGLKISGDSMFPKYDEGDIVIFEDSRTYPPDQANNKDCAVMVNGYDATFKKVLLSDNGITLVPYNTGGYDIKMYSYKEAEDLPIRIIGIAREKRTKL